jgi:hypothetical protein
MMSQEQEEAPPPPVPVQEGMPTPPTEKKQAASPVTTYAIHNTVRGRHNRTLRAQQPVHHRFKQVIGDAQRRLIRGRPLVLGEDEFKRHLEDIKAKAALGILEVRTPAGEVVDLETLKPVVPPPAPPLPHPPLDTIARDLPWGQEMSSHPGDEPRNPKEPSLLSDLARGEEEEETAPDDDDNHDGDTVPDVAPSEHSPHHRPKGRKSKR